MPVSHSYDSVRNIVFTKVQGVLCVGDILDHFSELEQDVGASKEALHVVDFSGMTEFVFSIRIADAVPEAYSKLIRNNVLRGSVLHGIQEEGTRMQGVFGVIRQVCGYSDLVRIVPDEDTAIALAETIGSAFAVA